MSVEFWLGLFLSIPIGLGTSLCTPWLQRKLEERGKHKALIQLSNRKAEFDRITFYKDHSAEFTQYLVQVAIKTTFIGAALAVFSGFIIALGQITLIAPTFVFESVRTLCFVTGQLISLVGSIMILNICRPALSAWTKVRNFEEYKKDVAEVQIA